MDPELKKLLEETHALVKDNHQMLHAIRRGQHFSLILTIVFWLAVFITPLYLYQQYLQPLIAKFSPTTGVTASGPFGIPTFTELQKLLNSSKAGQ